MGVWAYEIGQMDVTLRIQQDVIRLNIPVYDALGVDISQSTTQLRDPESHGLFCEAFSRDVEPQITTVHQVHHNVTFQGSASGARGGPEWLYVEDCCKTHIYSISWKLYLKLQRKAWFKCSSIRRSRIIFRTLSDRTTGQKEKRNLVSFARQTKLGRLNGVQLEPSSFRMYLRANVNPVSFFSTIRTLPKAPFPTTRNSRN